MEQRVNEVIVNELSIQFKNLELIDECINDVKNALVDISKTYKEEQKNIDESYQKGLDDAWEAARRISVIELNGGLSGKELMKIYGTMDIHKIYDDNTASEAIEKLKAYEEKQKSVDEIKVGDEVIDEDGKKFWVTKINNGIAEGIVANGEVTCAYLNVTERTGRHIDIDKILEKIKK